LPELAGIRSAARRSCLPLTLAPILRSLPDAKESRTALTAARRGARFSNWSPLMTAAKSAAEVRIVSTKHLAAAASLTSSGPRPIPSAHQTGEHNHNSARKPCHRADRE
jgi:hypothetical protein